VAVGCLAAVLPGGYLLVTSTTHLVSGVWPYDVKRMLQFALLLLLFLLPMANRRIGIEFGCVLAAIPRWLGLTVGGIFGWGVISALVNAQAPMHLANSLSEVALLGLLVLAIPVIAACRRVGGVGFDRLAVGLLVLTGLVVGVQELLGVAAAHAGGVEFSFRVSLLHFSWPRFYNQVQSWIVPVTAALPLLFSRYGLARMLCVLVLALHWYIILMTGARGSFLALIGATTVAAVFLPVVRRPLLQWQSIGLVLGLAIYGLVLLGFQGGVVPAPAADPTALAERPAAPGRGFYRNEDEETGSFLAQSVGRPLLSPMGRTWMWKVALRDARAHPLLGIGPMNYVCTSPEHIGHPHNYLLQIAAEWGIPAALAICLVTAILMVRAAVRTRRNRWGHLEESQLAGLLLTGVAAAALHALVSGVLVMPASQVAGLLVCGMLVGLLPPKNQPTSTSMASLLALSSGLLAVAMLTLGSHELRTLPDRSGQLQPGEDMRPRIWQDAKVCRLYVPPDKVRK
jgi:hypothetical protein